MAYIYKIINDINDKVYIGKTAATLQRRWREHKSTMNRSQICDNRPLYRAMQKYGVEHFQIQEIEECDNDIAAERECFWIEYYDSYNNGYNATLGGDGQCKFNYEDIYDLLVNTNYSVKKICQEIGCCGDIVGEVAKLYNFTYDLKKRADVPWQKQIDCYSLNEEFIQTFNSAGDAVLWCVEQGTCSNNSSGGAKSHITDVCKGKRQTAFGYKWKYRD